MKIVFFGTSEFAIPALKSLIGSPHEVAAVVTQPDRKRGRNLKLQPPPAKVIAAAHDIPVYQPQDASSAESVQYLRSLNAELFVVISFGQILKKGTLSLPKHGAINVHGSLLPKYRGAAPTNWAIINGEKVSGVTVIRMNERLDEGDMVLKKETPIDAGETNITLSEKLEELGAAALLEAIGLITAGRDRPEKQDGAKATYAAKLKKEDGLIDWSRPADEICRRIRGFIPWPGAYTHHEGKMLKILHAELHNAPAEKAGTHGEVLAVTKGKGIIVATGSGAVAIRHLQLEGKKILDADSFVRGHRIPLGARFS